MVCAGPVPSDRSPYMIRNEPMPFKPLAVFAGLLAAALLFPGPLLAQTLPGMGGDEAPPAAEATPDPLGRETPQGLVSGLIGALGAGDYDKAARYFEVDAVTDTSGRTVAAGAALARTLQDVLDRGGELVSPVDLSADAAGDLDDGLAEDVERIGAIKAAGAEIGVLADKVERNGMALWVISDETLSRIPSIAASFDAQPASRSLLSRLPQGPTVFGVPSSHWLALIGAAIASAGVAWLMTAARRPVVRLIRRGGDETRLTHLVEATAGPIWLILAVIVFSLAIQTLGVSLVARYRALFIAQIVGWVAFAWLLWRGSDATGDAVLSRMSRRGQLTAYSAVSFFKRAFKVVLMVVFAVSILGAFGIDVTTGLAALGIGGLAIALGAQKLFENLIGSLTLIADRPVRIGDVCRFGDTIGTVQEIGIRSTRIRTLDRTVLTVPNGEFSSLHIENYSQRDEFWFHPILNLRYETRPDQVRFVLQELRAMLYAHPRVNPDPARVRFVSLGAHSLDIEVFAYVRAQDYSDFLEVQEDLLLRCMEVVEKSGTGFAFPSQTLYLARDTGVDEDRTREAVDAVQTWRDNGELQIPRFGADRISALRNSIDYPPAGAAANGGGRR